MCIQRIQAKENGIKFTSKFLNIDTDQLAVVKTDEKRVMQVLLCLQSNALKFTRKGSVTIEVSIEDEFLKISVIDTGVGIPIADQQKLFKLFGFVQSTSHLNKNGIGLGLVIADQIVSQFEGSITFTSTPDIGSVFSYTFKLDQEQQADNIKENTHL